MSPQEPVVRMWETRLAAGQADAFVTAVRDTVLPALRAAHGFAGVELYRSDDADRVVLVTHWSDAAAAADGEAALAVLAAYCARPPHAWTFTPVPL